MNLFEIHGLSGYYWAELRNIRGSLGMELVDNNYNFFVYNEASLKIYHINNNLMSINPVGVHLADIW